MVLIDYKLPRKGSGALWFVLLITDDWHCLFTVIGHPLNICAFKEELIIDKRHPEESDLIYA